MELWNEDMRRWVKAGIRPRLTYVFDVADTRPVRGARDLYLCPRKCRSIA